MDNHNTLNALCQDILIILRDIENDLLHNINHKYNESAAQRARVSSVRLSKLFKKYRSESMEYKKFRDTYKQGKNGKSKSI